MAVTVSSSSAAQDAAQTDGRRWTKLLINLSNGRPIIRRYLAPVGDDAAAALADLANRILDELADAETMANVMMVSALGSLAVPTFVYSTAAQNVAAAREAYRSTSDEAAIMLADYFNTLTNGQLQSAFGINLAQATALRTNTLAPAAVTAAAIRIAVGQ